VATDRSCLFVVSSVALRFAYSLSLISQLIKKAKLRETVDIAFRGRIVAAINGSLPPTSADVFDSQLSDRFFEVLQ